MPFGAELVPEDEWMHKVLKKYEKWLPNGDRIIVEVVEVGNPIYKDGIMYTFRCIAENGETLFAAENSHGKPHIHSKGKKTDVDWNWRQALEEFDKWVHEHEKKNMKR